MIHVLSCSELEHLSDDYARIIDLEKLTESSTSILSQTVLSINPSLIEVNIEAEIKSFLLTKDSDNPNSKTVSVILGEFLNYFSKYNKYEPFYNVCKQILTKQNASNRRNCKVVFHKGKDPFSYSKIMSRSFVEYPISYVEMQVLSTVQKAILKYEVLTPEVINNLTYFFYKIGVLSPFFFLEEV